MEINGMEASLEGIQSVFLSEFKKIAHMIKGCMESINLLKKDCRLVNDRLEKLESIIESIWTIKQVGNKSVCSDFNKPSSSINILEAVI